MKARIRSAAKEDLKAAVSWYNKQRKFLGTEFLGEVDRTIQRILLNPRGFRIAHQDQRVALVTRFPYLVYFRILPSRIEILAVLHARRKPSTIKART